MLLSVVSGCDRYLRLLAPALVPNQSDIQTGEFLMIFKRSMIAIAVCALVSPVLAQDAAVEEIVVWGERAAELNAREAERGKDIFSSIISPDDVGNFTDQNVAESLRRLPGVTLQRSEGEGKFVTVRGLGPGFVNVTMNGTELASASGDTRAFALDALPSDILGSIEVQKSLTPDMDLNSIGGAVNVNTISAWDRGDNRIKFKLQTSNQDARDENGWKSVLSGTQLFADETVGLGFSLSYEDRPTLVDEIRHHSTGEMLFRQQNIEAPADAPEIIAPRQVENRQEVADRERIAGSFDLEFRPTDTTRFYVRGGYTEYTDNDLALREYFDFQDAGGGEIAYVNDVTGEFIGSDTDVFHQYFIQEGTTTTSLVTLGGQNEFGGDWTADYEYSWSKSNWDKPNGRRVQFRERDLVVWGQGFGDIILGRVVDPAEAAALGGFDVSDFSSSDIRGVYPLDPAEFDYDNLFLEDSFREDNLDTLALNLTRSFDSGKMNYLKTGVRWRARDRDRNKDRWSYNPSSGDCGGDPACEAGTDATWADFDRVPAGSQFTFPFIQRSDAENLIAATRITRDAGTNGEVSIDSTKDDYVLTEDTLAAYLMGEFQLSDTTSLIAGFRWEETEFESTGYFSIENDDFFFAGEEAEDLDIAIPMDLGKTKYDDIFPSLHLRYEPRDDILVRTSLWTSFVRPSFSEARAFAKIDGDIELCVPGTRVDDVPGTGNCDDDDGGTGATPEELQSFELAQDNSIQVGNPYLKPMTSTNFDASIGWYASESLFLQAAVFYKDVKDFIIAVNGAELGLDELPVPLPLDQVTQFYIDPALVLTDVDLAVNGDSAKVYGAELTYSQFFQNGLFLHTNLTLLESEAKLDPALRVGTIKLPDQADFVANVSAGWESDSVSLRFIVNYRDDVLESVGSCGEGADANDPSECKTWADRYQRDILNVDFKANYRLNDRVSFYFDALNLTEEDDLRYFKGNALTRGQALYQIEKYGRSYQLGMNVDFNW
jgi:TonB-dependent receptor